MLEGISWPYMELTWIQVFLNVRIVGNGATQLSCAKFKNQNASNATVSTNQKTTMNSDGAARQMTRLTHWGWKQRRGSHALILSSAQTIKEITKRTPTNVCSGDTGSTENGNKENMLRSVKTDPSQFILVWMANFKNDCEEPKNSFTKCSQKLFNH